jgi:hypothetical protein
MSVSTTTATTKTTILLNTITTTTTTTTTITTTTLCIPSSNTFGRYPTPNIPFNVSLADVSSMTVYYDLEYFYSIEFTFNSGQSAIYGTNTVNYQNSPLNVTTISLLNKYINQVNITSGWWINNIQLNICTNAGCSNTILYGDNTQYELC